MINYNELIDIAIMYKSFFYDENNKQCYTYKEIRPDDITSDILKIFEQDVTQIINKTLKKQKNDLYTMLLSDNKTKVLISIKPYDYNFNLMTSPEMIHLKTTCHYYLRVRGCFQYE